MMVPTIQQVTEELVYRLRAHLGATTDVTGGEKTAIEVVEESGDPVVEVQEKPKLAVIGPRLFDAEIQQPVGERTVTAVDVEGGTFTDAAAPALKDCHYQLIGSATRESSTEETRGYQWLIQQVALFLDGRIAGGPYLLAGDWTGDEADFLGYLMQSGGDPQRIPGEAASLIAFSATLIVRNVRVTDGQYGVGRVVKETAVELLDL